MAEINTGLEGIVVGATAVSHVDGELGQLSYRGYPIETLVDRPFGQVAWLLLFGDWPDADQEQQLLQFLLAHRDLSGTEAQLLAAIGEGVHPMLMLQAMVPVLDLESRGKIDLPDDSETARHGLIIAARLPSLVAAYFRREQGLEWPLTSRALEPQRGLLENMHGASPGDMEVSVLDKAQILQMEHSYNAGTFAGRVALSTQAPVQSSISASLGTLFGKLHGGADQAALEFAAAVGDPSAAAEEVKQLLCEGGRVMGMGHREYRTVDPRATLLKPLARHVCTEPESERLLATLEAIEAACIDQLEKPGKPIRANVEFYKGAVFHALGIPSRYFTAMFAVARVYGYLAHALEFVPQARLIRPRATYIGRDPNEHKGTVIPGGSTAALQVLLRS
jgi:citrate synthase